MALIAGLEALGFVTRLYHWIFYEDLIQRAVEPTTLDVAVGVLVIALVLEISRRLMAWEPPTLCGLLLLYALFGKHLPRRGRSGCRLPGGPLSWPEPAVAFLAAPTIAAVHLTDKAGFALAALLISWRRWRNRQPAIGAA